LTLAGPINSITSGSDGYGRGTDVAEPSHPKLLEGRQGIFAASKFVFGNE